MARNKNSEISQETQDEAMQIAKRTQKKGQTKEQTRLIAQGIQKGIAEYKKSVKSKQREADKAKKKQHKASVAPLQTHTDSPSIDQPKQQTWLPWGLLVASWLGFAAYIFSQM